MDFLKHKNSIDRKVNIKDQITFPMFYHSIGSIRLPIDYYHGKQTLFVSFNRNGSRIVEIHIHLSFSGPGVSCK